MKQVTGLIQGALQFPALLGQTRFFALETLDLGAKDARLVFERPDLALQVGFKLQPCGALSRRLALGSRRGGGGGFGEGVGGDETRRQVLF